MTEDTQIMYVRTCQWYAAMVMLRSEWQHVFLQIIGSGPIQLLRMCWEIEKVFVKWWDFFLLGSDKVLGESCDGVTNTELAFRSNNVLHYSRFLCVQV